MPNMTGIKGFVTPVGDPQTAQPSSTPRDSPRPLPSPPPPPLPARARAPSLSLLKEGLEFDEPLR